MGLHRKVNWASYKNYSSIIYKELCQETINSPIKLHISPTNAYKARLRAIVYVSFPSTAIGEVIYNPKITNDGILQMLNRIILCNTITSIICNQISKYFLYPCTSDHRKGSTFAGFIFLCTTYGNYT